ncbi:MAG: hypothetical protein KKA81_14985 [Bacteroidetes bacterium]|nr:hypothetical protein [Bacteroidota bacterium]
MRITSTRIHFIIIISFLFACTERQLTSNPEIQRFKSGIAPFGDSIHVLCPEGWTIQGDKSYDDTLPDPVVKSKIPGIQVKDPHSKAYISLFPDEIFFDMERCPTGDLLTGTYPVGSIYNGMTVASFRSPAEYVKKMLIPAANPTASDIRITEIIFNPGFKESSSDPGSAHPGHEGCKLTSAIITSEYKENDTLFLEKFHCMIVDYGQMGGGMWASRNTWSVRAPEKHFRNVAPVLSTVLLSMVFDPVLYTKIINPESIFEASESLKETSNSLSLEAIMESMFTDISPVRKFKNPFNGKKEFGTSYWQERWQDSAGNVICSRNKGYDPSLDPGNRDQSYLLSEPFKM